VTASPGVQARRSDGPLRQGVYHKYQSKHSDSFGTIGSGERGGSKNSRGVAYKDGMTGETRYRGVTG